MANPKVFFDLTVDAKPAGRIVIELFADLTPRTAENFRALCTGERGIRKCGKPLHYKGSIFDDIVPDLMWCGGDIIFENESIHGEELDDEYFILNHEDGPGIISMADSNGSQFQIHMKDYGVQVDGDHVVFGKVVEGLDLMKSIEKEFISTTTRTPSKPVVIADCGELSDYRSDQGNYLINIIVGCMVLMCFCSLFV
ncbi:Cyclophilin-type peptidyl-prolyl cis-trans isomerase domain [Arabidopsis thaliana x Arabidopsis arenosa]|uniref:Cyclophilin-type peptidyl-prolyl cis-trans isomerase domain n=1 Tax=Arabidopsis thaliana x Arabidopsis arenosa TaxID=1240361 RepID=A0A8T2AYG8_9BRAS|nr:Cyclophilin-type peptidyl-prolyl cis-trans isomerase domain [Arabidopsis thaliana x Arabidopsis arenosa]